MKWKLVQPKEGFDDCVELYVVNGSHIEVIVVNLVRNSFEINKNVENDETQTFMLDQFVAGNVIDWSKTEMIHKYAPIAAEGNINSF